MPRLAVCLFVQSETLAAERIHSIGAGSREICALYCDATPHVTRSESLHLTWHMEQPLTQSACPRHIYQRVPIQCRIPFLSVHYSSTRACLP